jgi:hypothetical protein
MSNPVESSNHMHQAKAAANPNDHLGGLMQEAQKAEQAFLNEAQKDMHNGAKWVKEHPHEDGMIVGGALVVGALIVGLRNEKLGAQILERGQAVMRDGQIASESSMFSSLGREGSVITKMKLGDQKEVTMWLDPDSPAAKQALRKASGLNDYFKR